MKNISRNPAIIGKPAPKRSCMGCREIKLKHEMVRLFRTLDGEVEIDISGKKEGRGAYLCRDWKCWETALRGKHLDYALKVKLNRGNLERLIEEGKELLKESSFG